MPGKAAFAWMTRIKAVEREFKMAWLALERLQQQAQDDPDVLIAEMRFRDIDTVLDRLEGTYLVRLFSEFETALRKFLRAKKLRPPNKAEGLVNKVRDRARVPDEHTDDVHKVREYRNTLVHDVLEPTESVTMREATKYCSTFLSWLQRSW
jgi:hypothetical protein